MLVEGDDTNEPIADTVRGILDGHIVLSRALAAQNHYPAIDILGLYQKNADLINIGAYKKGTNRAVDDAIDKYPAIDNFLKQGTKEAFTYDETVELMKQIVG